MNLITEGVVKVNEGGHVLKKSIVVSNLDKRINKHSSQLVPEPKPGVILKIKDRVT